MSLRREPIRVMVVDDSTVIRALMARIVEAEPDMRVVSSVANGRAAVEMLRHKPADVVLLDVEMPEMDGLTALPLILRAHPGAAVIMASNLTQQGAEVTLRALELGASDCVAKPTAQSALGGIASISGELVAKIRAVGTVLRARAEPAAPPPPPLPDGGTEVGAVRLLAIASSTGGPNALAQLLRRLPADFPQPIVVVQHMPPIFTGALAERLQRETGRPASEARHGERLQPGRTYVAPGDFHLTLTSVGGEPAVRLDQSPPVNYCRPAADPMLHSVAALYGADALAVVLTGMGEDGLRGSREIVQRGGRVLVQDRASSVVWGMPGAVFRDGIATDMLPLDALADRILELCSAGSGVA